MVTDAESSSPGPGQRERSPRVRCPGCGRYAAWRDNPHRPFCSAECRLVDLGGWLDERYRIESDPDEGDGLSDVP